MRYERWVQHNLIRDEGRLPARRELTQSASVEKTAALSTELRRPAVSVAGAGRRYADCCHAAPKTKCYAVSGRNGGRQDSGHHDHHHDWLRLPTLPVGRAVLGGALS